MASKSDCEDDPMTRYVSEDGGGCGAESRMDLGQTDHGRLSVVLCHECQSVHYELKCETSSALGKRLVECDQSLCRNSITWDEFFGSSLELAPSLLSIYDNLAAASDDNVTVNDNDECQRTTTTTTSITDVTTSSTSATTKKNTAGTDSGFQSRPNHARVGHSHSCVTVASAGFWVTDRCSHQRLFVRPASSGGGVPGRPLSLMEGPSSSFSSSSSSYGPASETNMDKDCVKKRPLSVSSLSSVSSASMPRLQRKRPNLSQDPEGSGSDHASHTSSDSNLTGGAMSDRVSLTSDRVSLTSDPVSLTSDCVSLTSTEENVPSKYVPAMPSDHHSEMESSVDPVCVTNHSHSAGCSAEHPALRLDTSYVGQCHDPVPMSSSVPSPSLSSRTSSCSSVSSSPAVHQQHCLSWAEAHGNVNYDNDNSNNTNNSCGALSATSSSSQGASPGGHFSVVDDVSSKQQQQPVVMRPLQTTTRPVVMSLPDFIRKSRNSSSGSEENRWTAPADGQWKGGRVECSQSSRHSSVSSTTTLTPGSPTRRSVSSPSVDDERRGFFRVSRSASSVSSREMRVGSTREENSAGTDSRPRTTRHSLATSMVSLVGTAPSYSPARSSSCLTSPVVSPHGSSHHKAGDLPPQPSQVQNVAQHSSSSLLSPTAIARRRFLSSHFDIPDVPLADSSPAESKDDSCLTQAEKSAKDNCAPETPPGRRSASLTVPSTLSLNRNSDVSPMSSPCGSPSSAMYSEDSARERCEDGVGQGLASPSTPGSPPSRGRSSKKQDGGAVSGKMGSVKGGGSYVTYVQRVVTEIVETERMYVDSLEAIIKGYLEPLQNMLATSPTGHEDLACLFCNIGEIYDFGKVFLADLEMCGLDPVKVAESFVRHNNGFVIYTEYCTNYPRAVEVLTRFMQDADLSEVCKACQVSLGHGLPLGAYLLRPVQRILKYHLLLQNILKNFDKNRPGHGTLEKALDHMTAMAHHINEMKRRHEHAVRIQEVQSQLEDYSGEDLTRLGELVLEGSFRVYGAKASRQVFLFERGILISKKKEGGMLAWKAFVPCSNLMLVEVIPNEPLSFHIIPFDNPRAQHTLQARSMEQKRHWCQDIKRLILESYKGRIPDNVKSLVMELGRNHDNDYVGKDAHDSPWKHQHTAPEYLEKRRFRRKSGGKGPDVGPFLKLPKPGGGKRDQVPLQKSKSPKPWRKSDSKLTNSPRERSESLPRMLASATSLIGITAPAAKLSSESFSRPNSSSASHGSPYTAADGNNNKQSKNHKVNISPADMTSRGQQEEDDAEAALRRTSSFKRAMRMQPLYSQDLDDLVPMDIPMADDTNPGVRSSGTGGDQRLSRVDRFSRNGRQEQAAKRNIPINSYATTNTNNSSPSDVEDSSDTDNEDQRAKRTKDQKKLASMYSSLPALNSLERKPAQKRRAGETKSGIKPRKKDLSKSSDTLADEAPAAEEPSTTRQYRRRWEGKEDGMQKKVPALYDSYVRRSRENLLRKKAKGGADRKSSSGAKLTDWGSVDKLTHGSLSDLSHLKEDPWVKLSDSPAPFPHSRNSPIKLTAPKPHPRAQSMSVMQTADWNPGAYSPNPSRPRNYSDVTEVRRKSGKENMDWMVYLKRNQEDHDIRERANSLSQVNGKPRACSVEFVAKALRDSNPNIPRSPSLCEETMKRYSLDLSDSYKLPAYESESASPKRKSAGDSCYSSTPVETKEQKKIDCTVTPASNDVEMADVSKARRSLSPPAVQCEQSTKISPQSLPDKSGPGDTHTPMSPPTPRALGSVQLLSPLPYSPRRERPTPTAIVVHSVSGECHPEGQKELTVSHTNNSHRPVSPHSAALSAEGDRMVAEMEKYCESNPPEKPSLEFKFPPSSSLLPHTPNSLHTEEANVGADINRLSVGSSVSSASATDGCLHLGQGNVFTDPNPNRLSGVSSVSTSSYESQNSNSSDSLVGTLKNKLNVWTHKLGGRKSREEEGAHHHNHHQHLSPSTPKDGLSSPSPCRSHADLHEVLREHSLGSPLIGSRMANTLPVGFEPILSPTGANKQALSSYEFSSKEGTPEPQTRFSFPSAVFKQNKSNPEAFPGAVTMQQSDSGISVHSSECGSNSSSRGQHQQGNNRKKAYTLPANFQSLQQFAGEEDSVDGVKRRDSASSTDSGDSFYERRLSMVFESGALKVAPSVEPEPQKDEPQSPGENRTNSRKSIRDVVQFIEQKFKPRQPAPVEVKRKEPSLLIRQRLQSLRDNSSYKLRHSNRSVSEDRGRGRDRTPESPRIPRPEQRSRSTNQFMHRVQSQALPSVDMAGMSREREKEREREMAAKRAQDAVRVRPGREQGRESEERSEGGSAMSGSMDRLEQLSADVNNLVIMRGWVRSLINKFQQIT